MPLLFVLAVIGIWFWQGDPPRDVRRLFGQQTYEDRMANLQDHSRGNRIGDASDVWLIKRNWFGEQEKTALFFGYWDDWDACNEFATMYMQRHPLDSYACEFAN